jgi:inward rectifier potassium channel
VSTRQPITLPPEDKERDLGFGSSLSQRPKFRLLNRDGSFNVKRHPPKIWDTLYSYNSLITMNWPKFLMDVLVVYLVINTVFALGFVLCGPDALRGDAGVSLFLRAFFFSVHTFATIGYGNVTPSGLAANLLVTLESLVGLMSFALLAGLVFARFSRPTANILYSNNALVAPFREGRAFMFRIMNNRDNELLEVQASVVLSRFEEMAGLRQRRFYTLALDRTKVAFFPTNWTIVHPIDQQSPLYGWDEPMLRASEAEFLVLLTATDDTFAQTVHNRGSYTAHEVIWGAKFLPVLDEGAEGAPALRTERFHDFERT